MGKNTLGSIESRFCALDKKEANMRLFFGEPLRNVVLELQRVNPAEAQSLGARSKVARHRFFSSINGKPASSAVSREPDEALACGSSPWQGEQVQEGTGVSLTKGGLSTSLIVTEILNRTERMKKLAAEAVTHRAGGFREQLFHAFKERADAQKERENHPPQWQQRHDFPDPADLPATPSGRDTILEADEVRLPRRDSAPSPKGGEAFPEWEPFLSTGPPPEWRVQKRVSGSVMTPGEEDLDGLYHKIVPRARRVSEDYDAIEREEEKVKARVQAQRNCALEGQSAACPPDRGGSGGGGGGRSPNRQAHFKQGGCPLSPQPPEDPSPASMVAHFKNPQLCGRGERGGGSARRAAARAKQEMPPKQKGVVAQNRATRRQYASNLPGQYLSDGRKRPAGFNAAPVCRPRPQSASGSGEHRVASGKPASDNGIAFVHQKEYYDLHVKVLHSSPAVQEWRFDVTVTDVTFPDATVSSTLKNLRINAQHYIVFQEPGVCVLSPVDMLDWVGDPADLYRHTLRIEVVGVKPFTKVVDTLVYFGEDKPERADPNNSDTARTTFNTSGAFVS